MNIDDALLFTWLCINVHSCKCRATQRAEATLLLVHLLPLLPPPALPSVLSLPTHARQAFQTIHVVRRTAAMMLQRQQQSALRAACVGAAAPSTRGYMVYRVPRTALPMAATASAPSSAAIIDGKAIAEDIRREIATEVAALKPAAGRAPGLAVVLVGSRKDSETYVRSKKKACAEVWHTRTHVPVLVPAACQPACLPCALAAQQHLTSLLPPHTTHP